MGKKKGNKKKPPKVPEASKKLERTTVTDDVEKQAVPEKSISENPNEENTMSQSSSRHVNKSSNKKIHEKNENIDNKEELQSTENSPESSNDTFKTKKKKITNEKEVAIEEPVSENWDDDSSVEIEHTKTCEREEIGLSTTGDEKGNQSNQEQWKTTSKQKRSSRAQFNQIEGDSRNVSKSWDQPVNSKQERKSSGPESDKNRSFRSGKRNQEKNPQGSHSRDPHNSQRSQSFRGSNEEDAWFNNTNESSRQSSSFDSFRGNWSEKDRSRDRRGSRRSESFRSKDNEFDLFEEELRTNQEIEFKKVVERDQDLFAVPKSYSLAHCVAEDMNMGSGIAVQFRHKFNRVGVLLSQSEKTGGLAILEDEKRFIYYLVTKQFSHGKPTNRTLFSSLKKMRDHIAKNEVKQLAVPKLGCGLDRLEWSTVKRMLEFVFKNVNIEEILVCDYQPGGELTPQKHKNSRLVNVNYPIEKIDESTLIIYLSSEDAYVSPEMEELDKKFHFLGDFRRSFKKLGSIITFDKNKNYYLCGCIVKNKGTDAIDFKALQTCLNAIQKANTKWEFPYVGFQAIHDSDLCTNHKIINLLRNVLRFVDVYVCWPGELEKQMPPTNRESLNSSLTSDKEDSFSKTSGRQNDGNWRTPKSETKSRFSFN